MQQFKVIGLMSGSSLDGVDLCYAEFEKENGKWNVKSCLGETIPYSVEWKNLLVNASLENGLNFYKTHINYGHYLAQLVNEFIKKNHFEVDLISSHGHTIFHQPEWKLSCQIGDGAAIYAGTGIKTVSNLRSVDIALGGQGAPLVPVGERDLFDNYGMFLNLGGIANISLFDHSNAIRAFDISPCNMPLNLLCEKHYNVPYDASGKIASGGKLDETLLVALQQISFFEQTPPKSLGREFIIEQYLPVIESAICSIEDKLYTTTFHITEEISKIVNSNCESVRSKRLMVSGGGTHNHFLISILKQKCKIEIVIPAPAIIDFKEALIFGFLGVLRITKEVNSLASVTNASRNSIGGALWG